MHTRTIVCFFESDEALQEAEASGLVIWDYGLVGRNQRKAWHAQFPERTISGSAELIFGRAPVSVFMTPDGEIWLLREPTEQQPIRTLQLVPEPDMIEQLTIEDSRSADVQYMCGRVRAESA